MELLKKLTKERKLCFIWTDDEKMYEYIAVDLGKSFVICETAVKLRCWEVPRIFVGQFLKGVFKGYEKIELACD